MAKKFKSKAFESIHSSANALLAIGAIDKATMREFDESCIAGVLLEHKRIDRQAVGGRRQAPEWDGS